ncbi:hypothetical protein L3X38_015735 [Prunus dulcis]|uniref:Uncharacterized protein n=1 Tax=Prunus dulcis TaxID=3755 RepID=A0AAD4W424_PRUDU|nr:hypothetical protein L3X38_015735 [Prunus dulcis]
MSREARAIFSLLLMAVCAATVLADVPPSPSPTIPGLFPPGAPSILPPGAPSFLPPGAPTIPGLLPPGVPSFLPPGVPGFLPPGKQGDIEAECWSSLQGIPGCGNCAPGNVDASKAVGSKQ